VHAAAEVQQLEAGAAGGALAPLLQQPEVELAAGSSISSPPALSAEQIVSRAERLEALIHSCTSNSGATIGAAASAKRSLLPWLDKQPHSQQSVSQQLTAGSLVTNTAVATTNSSAAGSRSCEKAVAASTLPAALAASPPGPEEAAAAAVAAAAAAVSAASLSCQSSFQADLAVAFDEDARLHSLLASSSASICSDSQKHSTAQQACSNEAHGPASSCSG
jgi:hypothetical protein